MATAQEDPGSGRKPKAWQVGVTAVAVAYTVALFVGSIPKWMRWNDDVYQTVEKVRKTFYKVRVKPGLAVFNGGYLPEWTPSHMCIIVVGRSGPEQDWERVYESYPDCQYPTFRWKVTHVNLVMSGTLRVNRMQAVARHAAVGKKGEINRMRRNTGATGILKYFCAQGDYRETHMLLETSVVHYDTNKRKTNVNVVHSVNCATGRRMPSKGVNPRLVDGKVVVE